MHWPWERARKSLSEELQAHLQMAIAERVAEWAGPRTGPRQPPCVNLATCHLSRTLRASDGDGGGWRTCYMTPGMRCASLAALRRLRQPHCSRWPLAAARILACSSYSMQ